ncbi:MAG TPA: DUF721 domain-containing protein [Pyrinomonadaceae bacterium]|nr:DUF721 domain-containing protein [Pyrinomonadaceae bacterium]
MNELFRALPALLRQMEDNESLRQAVVFAAWRRIAGEGLREHAVPLRLFQKHLIVAVMSETWKKHLEHLSGQMIFKLNSSLEQPLVTFIEFRVDEETVKQERAKYQKNKIDEQRQRQLALEQVTPKMRRAADSIKDENLRYQFLLAAGSCLARKKNMK